ncbi:MAG: DUF2155 domain-containing protein [Actinomycetota bacterium]|nr:DUF2155 domain-containing protein [Actinomycetota bacterium]MDA8173760.1 DUF2155 domain-containing protein [Nitrospiraceae bacterium]
MFKKSVLIVMAAALVLSFASCKKKEQPAAPAAGGQAPGIYIPPGEPQVIVPDSVKGKWSAVDLIIQDKTTGKSEVAKVNIGGDYKIPGSTLKVQVVDFLPDFKMEGTVITSSSNDLNNPAARVNIYDGDKQIFKGWLYSKFPAIHPFQHEKYAVTLKDAIKKA